MEPNTTVSRSHIIGVLGVVDDTAITQASVVNEIHHANPSIPVWKLYVKALKVGKDHMGGRHQYAYPRVHLCIAASYSPFIYKRQASGATGKGILSLK